MAESAALRVASLLRAFDDGTGTSGRRTVSDLARSVGRERSQISRMLKDLERGGLVEQDPVTRTYRLGWQMLVLSATSGDSMLLRTARPILQALVARTGEVSLLSVQQGNRSLTVMREESHQSLRAGGWVGRRSPMHCTASGRALLFDSADEHIAALTADDFALQHAAMAAPTHIDELLHRVRIERARGYSLAAEEVEVGLASVGAPVRDRSETIVGVVNISGPSSRMIGRMDALADLVIGAAQAASRALHSPEQPTSGQKRRPRPR